MGAFRNPLIFSPLLSAIRAKKEGDPAPMGLAGAVYNAFQRKENKGVATPKGGSPLGISKSGNLAGGLRASQGGSPLGRMLT